MKYPELKIKTKTLAAESAIIRKEQNKALRTARHNERDFKGLSEDELKSRASKASNFRKMHKSLSHHRTDVVRREARHTHLAYGFLRGTPYKAIEAFCYETPLWGVVERMITKYSGEDSRVVLQRFAEWREAS